MTSLRLYLENNKNLIEYLDNIAKKFGFIEINLSSNAKPTRQLSILLQNLGIKTIEELDKILKLAADRGEKILQTFSELFQKDGFAPHLPSFSIIIFFAIVFGATEDEIKSISIDSRIKKYLFRIASMAKTM